MNAMDLISGKLVRTILELCVFLDLMDLFIRVHWDCVGAIQECLGDSLNVWETSSMCVTFISRSV